MGWLESNIIYKQQFTLLLGLESDVSGFSAILQLVYM